jgi:hypothetical protein
VPLWRERLGQHDVMMVDLRAGTVSLLFANYGAQTHRPDSGYSGLLSDGTRDVGELLSGPHVYDCRTAWRTVGLVQRLGSIRIRVHRDSVARSNFEGRCPCQPSAATPLLRPHSLAGGAVGLLLSSSSRIDRQLGS